MAIGVRVPVNLSRRVWTTGLFVGVFLYQAFVMATASMMIMHWSDAGSLVPWLEIPALLAVFGCACFMINMADQTRRRQLEADHDGGATLTGPV